MQVLLILSNSLTVANVDQEFGQLLNLGNGNTLTISNLTGSGTVFSGELSTGTASTVSTISLSNGGEFDTSVDLSDDDIAVVVSAGTVTFNDINDSDSVLLTLNGGSDLVLLGDGLTNSGALVLQTSSTDEGDLDVNTTGSVITLGDGTGDNDVNLTLSGSTDSAPSVLVTNYSRLSVITSHDS